MISSVKPVRRFASARKWAPFLASRAALVAVTAISCAPSARAVAA